MDSLFEYRRDMDSLCFTPEQKAELTARASHAAANQRRGHRPLGRTLVVAAAAAVVLAVGAGAAVVRLASDAFSPLFGTAQTEIVDQIGRPINASCTDSGVTITADAIIGDAYNAYVIYTITQEDGAPLVLPEGVDARQMQFSGQGTTDLQSLGGQHGSAWFLEDPARGVLQYVTTLSADQPLQQGPAKAHFEDLAYYDNVSGQVKPLVEGTWSLRFDVKYEDTSVSLPAGQRFTRDGIGFTITEITLSPVAVQVKYTADSRPDWGDGTQSGKESEQMSRERERYLGGIPLVLHLADGSTLDLTDSAGGGISPNEHSAECHKGEVLGRILPLEEVLSLTVGDVVIPVNAA